MGAGHAEDHEGAAREEGGQDAGGELAAAHVGARTRKQGGYEEEERVGAGRGRRGAFWLLGVVPPRL